MLRIFQAFIFLLLITASCKQVPDRPKKAESLKQASFVFEHDVVLPKKKSNKAPAIIMLHGYGSNNKDLQSFSPHMDERLVQVYPRAPKSLGQNKYCWYNLNSRGEGLKYNFADVKDIVDDIAKYLDQLTQYYNLDPDQIYLGGFSQGAILSLSTALLHSEKLAKVVCLSGQLYPEIQSMVSESIHREGLSFFVTHGLQDKVLAYREMQEGVQWLQNQGFKVKWLSYPVAHTISKKNFEDLLVWIEEELEI